MEIKIQTLECKLCGHQWVPRKTKIKICPKCKSEKWSYGLLNKKAERRKGKTGNDKM